MIHRDDHVLVVHEPVGNAEPLREIVCPHEADGKRGPCSYLTPCPCNSLYRDTAAKLEKLLRAAHLVDLVDDDYDDLERQDWIDGCTVPLNADMKIEIPGHEDCPNGGDHQSYDGEILTQRGDCGVRGEFQAIGFELIEHLDGKVLYTPGRYPITFEWLGYDEGVAIDLAEDPA